MVKTTSGHYSTGHILEMVRDGLSVSKERKLETDPGLPNAAVRSERWHHIRVKTASGQLSNCIILETVSDR
jgi:hypothetical protein